MAFIIEECLEETRSTKGLLACLWDWAPDNTPSYLTICVFIIALQTYGIAERADTASCPVVIDLGAKHVDGYAKFAIASCGWSRRGKSCFIHVVQTNHSFWEFVFPAIGLFLPAEMMGILRWCAILMIFACLVAMVWGHVVVAVIHVT